MPQTGLKRPASLDVKDGFDLFERHYTERTRQSLPAMREERVEPIAEVLRAAGFSEVTVGNLSDVHDVADHPPSAQPWYLVTGRRTE
jgi:hypothetical protein